MKYQFFTLIILTAWLTSCQTPQENVNNQIRYFFENMAEFKCADSTQNRVKMSFLFQSIKPDVMAFEFNIPDSVDYSVFYNSYLERIVDAYFTSRNIDSLGVIDSLFVSPRCDCDDVRNKIIEYYSDDEVFSGIFEIALTSFYGKIDDAEKVEISIDSLMQISMFEFDVFYEKFKGQLAFHFLCGTNPFEYHYRNKMNFLIPGFCHEALKNMEMQNAHGEVIEQISERIKKEEPILNKSTDLKKYEKELYQMLIEEGTIKKSLLNYYEQRRDIEPFRIVN